MRSAVTLAPLMGNPVAQAAFLAIPTGGDPLYLADDYRLACARGDKDAALALELHIRMMAQTHFHEHRVLRALELVEKTPKRAFGKNGSQDFKRIARAIEVAYSTGNYAIDPEERLAVFHVEHLTLRCRNNPSAVAVLVAKYNRGFRK